MGTELLSGIFGSGAVVDYHGDRENVSLDFVAAKLGAFALGQATLFNCSISREIGNALQIIVPVSGNVASRIGRRNAEAVSGRSAPVALPMERVTATAAYGVGLGLTLPIETLLACAERLTGKSVSAAAIASMPLCVDLTSPTGGALARNAVTAFNELTRLDAIGLPAIALDGYSDLLQNLAAIALMPEVARSVSRRPARCGPAAIHRARDFIAEHASEALELSALAADLGLSMRTMQDNFQRHFGLSPRDFLMECRMELARSRLQAPIVGQTVTRAAVESGFTDLGHFSSRYRQRYGELPSQTLRSAQS